MWVYILHRLLLMVPTLFGIVLVTFVLLQMLPGGPVDQMVALLRAHERAGESGPVGQATYVHGYTSSFGIFRPKGAVES